MQALTIAMIIASLFAIFLSFSLDDLLKPKNK